jgi:hypothetical protein
MLISGLASVIGWLTGLGDNGPKDGSAQPATQTGGLSGDSGSGRVPGSGSSGHFNWPLWMLGTTTMLIAVVAGLLIFAAITRGRREDFVLDGAAPGYDEGAGEPDYYPVWDDDEVTAPETGPPPTSAWPGRNVRGGARFDTFSTRMTQLAHDFVLHVVACHDRPPIIDLQAPVTQRFVAAFAYAIDLFLDRSPRDPVLMSAAISEAERRWTLVKEDHRYFGGDTSTGTDER